MKKVLITGASGQLGAELVELFSYDWKVLATDQENLDITNPQTIGEVFNKEKPDWVIHCAAWTDVEGCAQNPEKALFINGQGTRNIAEKAKEVGAKVLYISTNEVFDGKKSEPYVESDQPNPINPYAVSKLVGEKAITEVLGKDGVIVRTSWVYGPKGVSNFPLKILAAAKEKKELKVTADEISTPTYAPDLAVAIKKLVDKDHTGIFHLVSEDGCSRYDWAKTILEGKSTVVSPIKLADYVRKSTTPPYTLLANTQAKNIGILLPSWKKSVQNYSEIINSS